MKKNGTKALVKDHIAKAGGDRAKGLASFRSQITDLIEEENLTLKDISLKTLYEAVVDTDGIIDENDTQEVSEAMVTSGYPIVVSQLIHPEILAAYEPIANVAMELVREVTSTRQTDTRAGFGSLDNFELVKEAMPYEETQPAERKVTIPNNKFGKTISLTMEMVMFDQTHSVLDIASRIGENAGHHMHKMIIQKATSAATTATGEAADYSLVINGSNHGLFSADHTALSGYANDNTATSSALTAANLDIITNKFNSIKTDKGEEILMAPKLLLINPAQLVTARVILESEAMLGSATVGNLNPWKGAYKIVASPFVTAGTWYIGDFARQTLLQWVYKLKTETLRNATQKSFDNDIVAQFKAGYFCGVGCTDYRFVQKSIT